MAKNQEQRFEIVFKKLDEILSAKAGQQALDLGKQESDEIDELRRLALETREEPAPQVVTST